MQEVVAAIRAEIGDEHLFMAEVLRPIERLVRYYGAAARARTCRSTSTSVHAPGTPEAIADLVERYEAALPEGAWPNWVLGNHDQPRVASRVGPAQARVAAMLLLTLRGTPTLYYGDELGMTDAPVERFDFRDGSRTPIHGTRGGFTTGEPWLPMGAEAKAQELNLMLELHPAIPLRTLRRGRRNVTRPSAATRLRCDHSTASALRCTVEPRLLASRRTGPQTSSPRTPAPARRAADEER